MKRFYSLLVVLLIVANCEAATITTGAISPASFCAGASLSVPYSVTGTFHSGNVFTAYLSDNTGTFGTGQTAIGSLISTTAITINATIPSNASPGALYRIRVTGSNPSVNGTDNGSNLTIFSQPSAAITAGGSTTFCSGSSVILSANSGTGLTYQWKKNGANISGATSISYYANSQGSYTCAVSNACSTGLSNAINVTVNLPPQGASASSNSPICQGSTLNLSSSASGSLTYSWSGPNNFTSTLQNPSIPNLQFCCSASYFVTVTNTCGSTGTYTNVTINPLPAAMAGSNSPVCVGGTLNLSCYAYNATTYNWTGPNSFTSTLQNPIITGINASYNGTYSIAVSNNCGSYSTATSVIVNTSLPIATASNSSSASSPVCGCNLSQTYYYCPTCYGSSIGLNGSGGITYHWTGPNGFTSTQQNPNLNTQLSPDLSGYYQVNATNGCGTSYAQTYVYEDLFTDTLISTTPTTFCGSMQLDLHSYSLASITHYVWWGSPDSMSCFYDPNDTLDYNNGILNYQTMTFKCTVTDIYGCGAISNPITFFYKPVPYPVTNNSMSVCTGSNIQLTCSQGGLWTYHWTGPNGLSSTLQNVTINNASAVNAGNYFVDATDTNGCTGSAGTYVTINSPVTAIASSNSPTCAGTNLFFNASGGTNYQWSGPNGFSSTKQNPYIINVTAANSGTYTVIVSNICYSATTTTIVVVPSPVILNLKFFTQGYYINGGSLKKVLYNENIIANSSSTNVDTVVVELHNATSPYAVAETFKGVLQTNGAIACNFSCNITGHSYYIAVKHRNTIQTWSAVPVAMTATTSYDFTTSANKAYGNNMILVQAGVWAFYSADINQDENVDLADFPPLDYGIIHGLTGYYASDLNGDGNVDLLDFPMLDANILGGYFSMHP